MTSTLKKGLSLTGKTLNVDTASMQLNDEQRQKLQNAGYTINEQKPVAQPAQAQQTPVQNITPAPTQQAPLREYISPKLQARIDAKNAPSQTVTAQSGQEINVGGEGTGLTMQKPAPKVSETPQIAPETTIEQPQVQPQAATPKNTPEVVQNQSQNLESYQKFTNDKTQQTIGEFQSLLQAGDLQNPRIQEMMQQNPTLRKQFRGMYANYYNSNKTSSVTQSLALKTPLDVENAIQSGTVIPGTKEWDTLAQTNPQIIQAYNQKREEDTKISLINGEYKVDPFDPKKQSGLLLQQIANLQSTQGDSLAMYEQFMNVPEITNASTQITALDNELITVGEQIQGIDTSVRETLPAGVPESIIAGEVANRQKGLYQKVTALESRKQAMIENYNRLSQQALQKFEIYQQDKKQKMDFMMNVYGIARQEEIRYEDMQRQDEQYQKELERSDYEYQRAIERGDYEYARNLQNSIAQMQEERQYNEQIAMENTLLQMGVNPAGMDKQIMYAELSKRVREQQQQQAYLAQQDNQIKAYNAQKGNWKIQDGYMINQDTGEYQPLSQSLTPQGLDVGVVGSLVQQCRTTGQCGEGVNDYLQKLGEARLFGDSYASKTQNITPTSGDAPVGSIAIWNPSGDNIGHVAIKIADNGDTITVRDWNWGLDEKQRTHEVPKSQISSTGGGYYVPKKIQEAQGQSIQGIDPFYQGIGSEFIENGKIPSKGSLNGTGMTPQKAVNEGVKQYIQGKNEGLRTLGFEITNISPYISASSEQRKQMAQLITNIPDFISKVERWKSLVEENGTEASWTAVGSEMRQLRTDVMTTLKSPAFLNLGVLQQVDLDFMAGLVPDSNAIIAPEWNHVENLDRLSKTFLDKISTGGKSIGISPLKSSNQTTQNSSVSQDDQTLWNNLK